MHNKKIKKVYELSKRKKSSLERSNNYWTAVFLGFAVAAILFGFNLINSIIYNIGNQEDDIPDYKLEFTEFVILAVLVVISIIKMNSRLIAIELKENKVTSLKKAKEFFKK
jgi:xanthine/uracil permease